MIAVVGEKSLVDHTLPYLGGIEGDVGWDPLRVEMLAQRPDAVAGIGAKRFRLEGKLPQQSLDRLPLPIEECVNRRERVKPFPSTAMLSSYNRG